MSFTFRPAKRENTPLIIGLAGPTKSGKTFSAHRLAAGLANGGTVAMINAEGAKGHQYSDRFNYIAADLTAPFRPERYTEALKAALALKPRPAVLIIDSVSHMHDGPGGILEYHEDELARLAGDDLKARQRSTYTAWVKPKAAENVFIYEMLASDCHLILCMRAKEKIKVVKGKPPIDLGWQPIVGERVAFETMVTLTLPPHSKGVPDMSVSEMREPFDSLIPADQPLSEETGRLLAEWAAGGKVQSRPRSDAERHGNQRGEEVSAQSDTGGTGNYADEADVTQLLEFAARVGPETHEAAVDGIARHRVGHDGRVGAEWLEAQTAKLREKLPAEEPQQEPMFQAPESARR
jgi:hypothetical protein